MPIYSMTGYGSCSLKSKEEYSFFVEIKSVNHKYLKISSKLPDFLNPIQLKLEKRLKENISRGAVSINIRGRSRLEKGTFKISETVLTGYLKQTKSLEKKFPFLGKPTWRDLLSLPGVIDMEQSAEFLKTTVQKQLENSFDIALKKLLDMRKKEGKCLVVEIKNYLKEIKKHLKLIKKRLPQFIKEHQKKVHQKMEALLAEESIAISQEDLIKEVAIYATKMDISEEMVRLHSHILQFTSTLKLTESVGRKMDFLAQEMLREANTMASKTNDGESLNLIVNIKSYIDKIKEQVQNIE